MPHVDVTVIVIESNNAPVHPVTELVQSPVKREKLRSLALIVLHYLHLTLSGLFVKELLNTCTTWAISSPA